VTSNDDVLGRVEGAGLDGHDIDGPARPRIVVHPERVEFDIDIPVAEEFILNPLSRGPARVGRGVPRLVVLHPLDIRLDGIGRDLPDQTRYQRVALQGPELLDPAEPLNVARRPRQRLLEDPGEHESGLPEFLDESVLHLHHCLALRAVQHQSHRRQHPEWLTLRARDDIVRLTPRNEVENLDLVPALPDPLRRTFIGADKKIFQGPVVDLHRLVGQPAEGADSVFPNFDRSEHPRTCRNGRSTEDGDRRH